MRNPVTVFRAWVNATAASVGRWLTSSFDRADVLMAVGTGAIGYGVWRRYSEADAAIVIGAILLLVGLKAVWR